MAEYIGREAAIKLFNFAVLDCLGMEPTIRAGDIIKALESIPAADVRPVVHGKWSIHEIYKYEMSYGVTGYEPVYKCSVCGSLMESYLRFDEPIMPEDASYPRFCPNCGADMREES